MNRRQVLASLATGICLPRAAVAAEEEPRLIRDDYALSRQHFQTNLLKRGPAPDEAPPLSAPDGTRELRYRSGTLELVAWISGEAAAKPLRPGILFLHGGNALWPGHWDLARPYVAAGYIAMMPAVRAENGLPGDFSGFYDETADVLAAAEVLAAQPGVDKDRLFIAGHSVGGALTLLAALSSPRFRAAAAFSGNPDARAFFRRFPDDIRFDAADPREFDMRSAVCFAASFKCPLLLLHGSGEHGSEAAIRLTAARAGSRRPRGPPWHRRGRPYVGHSRRNRRKPPFFCRLIEKARPLSARVRFQSPADEVTGPPRRVIRPEIDLPVDPGHAVAI